jgi:hypothetical protein
VFKAAQKSGFIQWQIWWSVHLFFIKRNAIAGSIIVKEIQYPFTIGDTSKDLAEFIKPNLMTSKKWIIWVMVPIRCPITSTAMINVNPLFLIFCILFFFFTPSFALNKPLPLQITAYRNA